VGSAQVREEGSIGLCMFGALVTTLVDSLESDLHVVFSLCEICDSFGAQLGVLYSICDRSVGQLGVSFFSGAIVFPSAWWCLEALYLVEALGGKQSNV